MTTDTTTAQDLTEPTRVLLVAAGASPSPATLWELVDVRGAVALGMATLSGEARAEVDALLVANAHALAASRWRTVAPARSASPPPARPAAHPGARGRMSARTRLSARIGPLSS